MSADNFWGDNYVEALDNQTTQIQNDFWGTATNQFSDSLTNNPDIAYTNSWTPSVLSPADQEDADLGAAMRANSAIVRDNNSAGLFAKAAGFFAKYAAGNHVGTNAQGYYPNSVYPNPAAPRNPINNLLPSFNWLQGSGAKKINPTNAGNADYYSRVTSDWGNWLLFGVVSATVIFLATVMFKR